GLAIDQIAQSGLSSLSVIYYSAQLFSMTNPEQSQVADSKPKVPASDDGIYRTTAKALAELYSANEVAADDKIDGRNGLC
ncbi:hypothetical protein QP135_27780, partial [Klebsiella pneumoniae]|nr:hypothetical protein [Klebsiella pneumoniae]